MSSAGSAKASPNGSTRSSPPTAGRCRPIRRLGVCARANLFHRPLWRDPMGDLDQQSRDASECGDKLQRADRNDLRGECLHARRLSGLVLYRDLQSTASARALALSRSQHPGGLALHECRTVAVGPARRRDEQRADEFPDEWRTRNSRPAVSSTARAFATCSSLAQTTQKTAGLFIRTSPLRMFPRRTHTTTDLAVWSLTKATASSTFRFPNATRRDGPCGKITSRPTSPNHYRNWTVKNSIYKASSVFLKTAPAFALKPGAVALRFSLAPRTAKRYDIMDAWVMPR